MQDEELTEGRWIRSDPLTVTLDGIARSVDALWVTRQVSKPRSVHRRDTRAAREAGLCRRAEAHEETLVIVRGLEPSAVLLISEVGVREISHLERRLQPLEEHPSLVFALSFCPVWLASGSEDKNKLIKNIRSRRLHQTIYQNTTNQ